MYRRLVPLALLAVALAWVSGCGPAKLNVNKQVDLEAGDTKAVDLVGDPKPQTITVEYSSPEEVSVYVYKAEDAKGEEGLLNASANAKKALKQSKGKGETFSVDLPENTPARVIVYSPIKKTSVQMKITNQK